MHHHHTLAIPAASLLLLVACWSPSVVATPHYFQGRSFGLELGHVGRAACQNVSTMVAQNNYACNVQAQCGGSSAVWITQNVIFDAPCRVYSELYRWLNISGFPNFTMTLEQIGFKGTAPCYLAGAPTAGEYCVGGMDGYYSEIAVLYDTTIACERDFRVRPKLWGPGCGKGWQNMCGGGGWSQFTLTVNSAKSCQVGSMEQLSQAAFVKWES